MDKHNYTEPLCCFDASEYLGKPDSAPCPSAVDMREATAVLDALLSKRNYSEALRHIELLLDKAVGVGDWRSELSLQSELMGLHRRTGDKLAAEAAVSRGLELIRAHRMGGTVSGATVMLNAATTLKFLGRANEAIPIFVQVSRVYSSTLDPLDYRFAGLFNNMATAYQDCAEYEKAEQYFYKALGIIRHCGSGNEAAVTCCNLAELYELMGREDRIESLLDKAHSCLTDTKLPRDGYNAFTISKCLPTFEHFGFFIYEMSLKERLDDINAGT